MKSKSLLNNTFIDEYWNKIFSIKGNDKYLSNFNNSTQSDFKKGDKELCLKISSKVIQKINHLSNNSPILIYNFYATIFCIVLGEYSGHEKIVFPMPQVLNKDESHTENMNIFKSHIDKNLGFKANFSRNKEYLIQSFDYNLKVENFQNHIISNEEEINEIGLIIKGINCNNYNYNPNLLVEVNPKAKKNNLKFIFKRRSYNRNMIKLFANNFKVALSILINDLYKPLVELNFLSNGEKRLLEKFNRVETYFPLDKNILEIIKESVINYPESIAIKHNDKEITYLGLDKSSNQIANYLKDNFKQPEETLYGIVMNRSINMVKSILAVWKNKGTYIPIDPDYPIDRINKIISSSKLKILLIDNSVDNTKLTNLSKDVSVICYDDLEKDILSQKFNVKNLKSSNLAYVIYTSGSTGEPKGVMIEHLGMLNHMGAKIKEIGIDRNSIVAQNAPSTFDISIWQLFSPLLVGGTTVIYDKNIIMDPILFLKRVGIDNISILELVPSYLTEILEIFENKDQDEIPLSLKSLILNAETLLPSMVKKWLDTYKRIPIINTYGATEVSDDIGHYIMNKVPNKRTVPVLKRPIQNFEIHIVDQNMNLVYIGVQGEILIAGPAVGRGYLNNESLTNKSFLKGPILGITKKNRVYKTGDLGRFLSDGSLEFLGRKDTQVKINGMRVELSEVEHSLAKIPEINNVKVIPTFNNSSLLGFYLSDKELEKEFILNKLRKDLPEYMIPTNFFQMDRFPLTNNGKINKGALISLADGNLNIEYVSPRNETEEKLVGIWSEVLKVDKEKIGVYDDFFALGGHSLRATTLISKIQQVFSVRLELSKVFSATDLFAQSELIIKGKKEVYVTIPQAKKSKNYVLSSSQRRLWVLSQFEGGNLAYNMPGVFEFSGGLDKEAFEKSFTSLVERHESLRTIFKEDNQGEIKQWILSKKSQVFKFDYYDLRKEKGKREKLESLIGENIEKEFDLLEGPLLRACLIQTTNKKYVFVFVMHHIISDGWSMNILLRDLLGYYDFHTNSQELSLPILPIQYKDYSLWQQDELKGEGLLKHKEYWLEQFEGELPILNMPLDYPRPAVQNFEGSVQTGVINKELTQKLKDLCQEAGSTLFMGLLGLINTLLYKYTGQTDIVIGSPLAGRSHEDFKDQIGFYINTLALRTGFEGEISFKELLKQIKENTLEAYEHQMYPFDELVDELDLKRDLSRNPLFDVMLTLQNNEASNAVIPSGLDFIPYELKEKVLSKVDFDFNFIESEKGLIYNITYRTDLFSERTMKRLSLHLENLLSSLLQETNIPIQEIRYLSEDEEYQILEEFNDTAVDYPRDKTIIDLFEEQVRKTPDNKALIFGEKEITYKELNEKSNQLGKYLRETYKIKPDDLVGIKLDRSEWMIVAILGVLKSGGAYVPIDPEYPQERIDYMLEDSQCKVLIDENELSNFKLEQSKYIKTNLELTTKANDLAYVIYTSGSTGKPKGVMIEHRNVTSFLDWSTAEFDQSKFDIVYSVTSFCFDLSIYELFYSLTIGKLIRLLSNSLDIEKYLNADKRILLNVVPSVVQKLLLNETNLSSVVLLNMAGERISQKIINELDGLLIEVRNLYGPSEDTTYSTSLTFMDYDLKQSIGKPISNTQIYILGKNEDLLPIGVVGEICIGGAGLARGYLNRPDLTAEKFVENPFKKGEKMYKTGDLGRWLPDGNIEFIGRKDDQVKIRGYRIELGEIESVLQTKEEIDQVVVLAKEVEGGDKQLVAYVISEEALTISDLRSYLKEKLPDYMVPSYFVQLDELPLTSNGKIDKKSLPNPEGLGLETGIEYVSPRNETEEKLVGIWSEVLKVDKEKIGVYDDFFALGGHSLRATTLISKIQQVFSVRLELSKVFSATDLFAQSELIIKGKKEVYVTIPQAKKSKNYVLSSSQRRLWVLSQFEGGNLAYNMPGVFEFSGGLDKEAFEKSFTSLVERHESLRTIFKEDNQGEIKQWILSKKSQVFKFDYYDLRKEKGKREKLESLIGENIEKEFDLLEGPLLRACLIQTTNKKYVFVFVMHHIISDGWSMNILLRDLLGYYDFHTNSQELSLPILPIQYKDYSLWQQDELKGEGLLKHKEYWLEQFEGELPILNMPLDYPRPAVQNFEGSVQTGVINKELTQKLKDLCQEAGSTLFMGLLGLINTLLYKYTGQTDIVIGSPLAGRSHEDFKDQIGFYINTLALRTGFEGEISFKELLKQIKENTLEAYEHQMYPFDELVDELDLKRDLSRNPLFDVMLTLQNNEASNAVIPSGLDFIPYELKEKVLSKVDFDFNFIESEKGLIYNITYRTDLFSERTMKRLSLHLENLLSSLLQETNIPIQEIRYLSEDEEYQILEEFNDTAVDYPRDKTIIDLFEEQVRKTPDNKALIFGEKEITYKELNEKSNQLGKYLRETYKIKPDDLVGIKLDRSEWMIVAILGVLKSGGAYVPIDPEYPQERIDYMLEDSQCKVLIDENELSNFKLEQSKYIKTNLELTTKANDLAYVIYTSGSTGKPKGVMIEHKSLRNLCVWHVSNFNLTEKDCTSVYANQSFDAFVWEVFPYITIGSCLHIISKEMKLDIPLLANYFEKNKISIGFLPSKIGEVFFDLKNSFLRFLLVGGDKLNYFIYNKYQIVNNYGPTESTVVACSVLLKNKDSILPIGKPINNTQIYILGNIEELLPIGVIGEICISGDGLARGYINHIELTAEKFVLNPFKENERMYKTGDLGRWLPDGNIEFIGRKDDQVKVRGYRIELGEIESVLQTKEEIDQVVVLAKEVEGGDKQLVSYVISEEALTISDLRSYLKEKLPEYMIPSHFVQIDELPLTPNGKIDKKSLPDPVNMLALGVEYVSPRNEIEEKIIEIWSEVLKIDKDKIGINDDFFALGGHSLQATTAIGKINSFSGIKIPLKEIFNDPSIKNLSKRIIRLQLLKVNEEKSKNLSQDEESFEL